MFDPQQLLNVLSVQAGRHAVMAQNMSMGGMVQWYSNNAETVQTAVANGNAVTNRTVERKELSEMWRDNRNEAVYGQPVVTVVENKPAPMRNFRQETRCIITLAPQDRFAANANLVSVVPPSYGVTVTAAPEPDAAPLADYSGANVLLFVPRRNTYR